MSLRVYLTGRICLEADGSALDERRLPGRQGRLLLAYLVLERYRPAARDELGALLWRDGLPDSWETALNALVSKLRSGLAALPGGSTRLVHTGGSYQLVLPGDPWVDVERALLAIDQAEAALRSADPAAAWGPALVAGAIARRPLLGDLDVPWLRRQQSRLADVLVRALESLAEACTTTGQLPLAATAAAEAIALEPFRETGYRHLMRVHAAQGNRAEALRVYERCRRLLAQELGADPSPHTQALYRELLH